MAASTAAFFSAWALSAPALAALAWACSCLAAVRAAVTDWSDCARVGNGLIGSGEFLVGSAGGVARGLDGQCGGLDGRPRTRDRLGSGLLDSPRLSQGLGSGGLTSAAGTNRLSELDRFLNLLGQLGGCQALGLGRGGALQGRGRRGQRGIVRDLVCDVLVSSGSGRGDGFHGGLLGLGRLLDRLFGCSQSRGRMAGKLIGGLRDRPCLIGGRMLGLLDNFELLDQGRLLGGGLLGRGDLAWACATAAAAGAIALWNGASCFANESASASSGDQSLLGLLDPRRRSEPD